MKDWEKIITEGNKSFRHKQWNDAISFYQAAKKIAQHYTFSDSDHHSTITAYSVSCMNLFDTFLAKGKPKLALNELESLYQYLSSFEQKENICTHFLNEAMRAKSKVRIELIYFYKNKPSSELLTENPEILDDVFNYSQNYYSLTNEDLTNVKKIHSIH